MVTKYTVSPDSVKKNNSFGENFLIKFVFEDYCKHCSKTWKLNLDEICPDCRQILGEEIPFWKSMEHILSNYTKPTEEDGENMHRDYKDIKSEALSKNYYH